MALGMDRRLQISKSHRQAGVAVDEVGPKGGRFGDALGFGSPSGLHRAGLFFRQKKGYQHGRIMRKAPSVWMESI